MNFRSICILLAIIGTVSILVGGACAEATSPLSGDQSFNNTINSMNSSELQTSNASEYTNLSVSRSNETSEMGLEPAGNESNTTGIAESSGLIAIPEGDMSSQIYSGTEHPNEATDVQSSTPSGDPLLNSYALGGVSIDIGAHIMEARGNDSNVSAELILKDHTSANGYMKTIQKDFHYESKVDTPEDI
ncbi:MAG: hypothetical protein LUQ50_11350 [Methanospirillum sp.]|uniref:hypothetical protein n=1 Tax=Methanospirillum sp. TaxID=45200 RepID=UPI002375BBFF|nr:hypothetical protein [Methanospirillum sp.]MDD1729650.1 hypothetical protein [Methanospirillum sp.]